MSLRSIKGIPNNIIREIDDILSNSILQKDLIAFLAQCLGNKNEYWYFAF